MSTKLDLFLHQHGIRVNDDGSFNETLAFEAIKPYFTELEKFSFKNAYLKVLLIDNRPCNICPYYVEVPKLNQKGWGKGVDGNEIDLSPVDINEFDLPVGSFRIKLIENFGIEVYSRNYRPQELGTNYFVETLHKDAQDIVDIIKSKPDILPSDPLFGSPEGVEDNETISVNVLGKQIGWYWLNGEPKEKILAPELKAGLVFESENQRWTVTRDRYYDNSIIVVWCINADCEKRKFPVAYVSLVTKRSIPEHPLIGFQ
ncbi:hypothetical protein FD723_40575 (plasmid) [Nostoc sp. C052]|uniref:hypothetical protein n=1 Tax=Nostoc sp. C052 TaxID=2576902 RepID=UPI0015C325C6|nr:hypothetical protein [Nostoc sp. C052]QLE46510.1 hypothetical protein FD723_40575 [Nostoc sp. C052]